MTNQISVETASEEFEHSYEPFHISAHSDLFTKLDLGLYVDLCFSICLVLLKSRAYIGFFLKLALSSSVMETRSLLLLFLV